MRGVAHQAGAYPSFCSIKQLGVFPLSVASLAGLPPVLSLPVPTYMGGEGHCEFKVSSSRTLTQCPTPGAHFSKALETFRGPQSHFWIICTKKPRGLYAWNSLYEENLCSHENMWIKQLCNHKVWDFAMAFRVQKLRDLWKRAPGLEARPIDLETSPLTTRPLHGKDGNGLKFE